MASRELKDTETSQGVTGTSIALDGIAVIVNKQNPVDELTSDQVMSIFTGETQDWSDVPEKTVPYFMKKERWNSFSLQEGVT